MTFAPGLKRRETLEETIERLTIPIPECGCYAWLGYHNGKDYAQVTYNDKTGKRKIGRVTRLLCAPVPDDLEVDHLCHQRWCVNPYHLEVVTHLENIRRHAAWKIANRQFCEKHGVLLRYYGRVRQCPDCKLEYLRKWKVEQRKQQGLPPAAPYRGQRKFICDDCGGPYVKICNLPSRGTARYGCRDCGRGNPNSRRNRGVQPNVAKSVI